MGEQPYAYRGHSNYGDYGAGDQVSRTVIYDSDGTKRTVLGSSPYESEYYVVETEVTEHIRAPIVTDYRHGSPKKVHPVRDYGSYGGHEKYRRPTSPPYNDRRPQDINQFLTGVQVEASRPPHRYSPSNGGAIPLRPKNHSVGVTPGYGGDRYKTNISSGYDGYSSDEDDYDREEEAYYKPGHTIRRPEVNRKYNNGHGGWVAPVSTHAPPPASTHTAANSKLSLPTNSIEEAVDFLKGGSKDTSNTSEVGNPYGYKSNPKVVSGSEPVRPYGYNYSNPKTGSLETVKPYGVKSNQTAGTGSQAPVIDCYEAARRYNGKVIRT